MWRYTSLVSLPRMRGDRPGWIQCRAYVIGFTPHARGSTKPTIQALSWEPVYPACAGIDLLRRLFRQSLGCLPRMRGDRPIRLYQLHARSAFTPHARGSTVRRTRLYRTYKVYPACAGIDPTSDGGSTQCWSLPRMRGDRPQVEEWQDWQTVFTPHARGSTAVDVGDHETHSVYPACAGIDLSQTANTASGSCLPRMRGDRPLTPVLPRLFVRFTPHARGSTAKRRHTTGRR